MKPFNIEFNSRTQKFTPYDLFIERKLSSMADAFYNQSAVNEILEKEDPVLSRVYMAPVPETSSHLMPLMTIIYPGVVGDEFYMTKGHIHTDLDHSPEVYITLSGSGVLVLQDNIVNTQELEMAPGLINYIPSQWAHRAVNKGKEPLIFLGVYPAEGKRDYSFIGLGKLNFKKIVCLVNEQAKVIDNPSSMK